MPKRKVIQAAVRDSESEDESESKASDVEDEIESEVEDEFDDDLKISASSTQIVSLSKSNDDVKLEIVEALSKLPVASQKHSKAVKNIKWDKIKIAGISSDELKEQLTEIIKATGVVRTLQEVLSDYKQNSKKYSLGNHPDRPTKPLNAHFLYFKENREKIMQKYEKANPGKKSGYFDIQKFAFAKYSALPEIKQAPYKAKFESFKTDYKKKLNEFYAVHPNLRPDLILKTKGLISKTLLLTPFSAFRGSLTNAESLQVAQKLWRDLHPEEKCKFIKEVANRETEAPKKISKDEWKILENEGINGVPKRPVTAYQAFVADSSKKFTGKNKDFLEKVAAEWKTLDEDKRNKYNEKHDKAFEEYQKGLKTFIKSLPKEKQPMMMQKYKKYLVNERKRKNSSNETVFEETKLESPKKKTKKQVEPSPMKIKQSICSDEDNDNSEPEKVKKNGVSSPKKNDKKLPEPVKRQILASSSESISDESSKKVSIPKKVTIRKKNSKDPVYPSNSTAHYFLTKIFKGNRKDIKKAYKALSRPVKAKYSVEMKRAKQNFLETTASYVKTIKSGELNEFKKKMKELKEQQIDEIAWHSDNGTDDEPTAKKSSSSGSSSSDSDSERSF